MKRMIKSYHAFAPWIWRWGMFLLLLVMIAFELVSPLWLIGFPSEMITLMVWMITEILADYWVFGGICQKGAGKIGYLQSSEKGMQLVKDSLWMDMIRKGVTMVLLMAVPCVAAIFPFGGTGQMRLPLFFDIVIFLGGFCIIEFTLNIVRYFGMWNYYVAASSLVILIGMLVSMQILFVGKIFRKAGETMNFGNDVVITLEEAFLLVILALFVAALAAFTIWHVMRCLQGGYQDEK